MMVATQTKYGKRRSVASNFIPTLKPGGSSSSLESFEDVGVEESEECCYSNDIIAHCDDDVSKTQ